MHTQACSQRSSRVRPKLLLLGRMMEEEDYDKWYYQGVLPLLLVCCFVLFFNNTEAQALPMFRQNTATEILAQVSPQKTFHL